MNRLIVIATNNLGKGLSGGDSIFLNFLKYWRQKLAITVFTSPESQRLIRKYKIGVNTIQVTDYCPVSFFSTKFLLWHNIYRIVKTIKSLLFNSNIVKSADYIYSVSDFYPDFIPAFLIKLFYPKKIWIASFYLFAPSPFSKNTPYKNQPIKGFMYWFSQIISLFLVDYFANYVFITSLPDAKRFKKSKTVIIQGGVDLSTIKSNEKQKDKTKKIFDAVFIGRLHPQKGILLLPDIWKKVIQSIPKAKLAIIGDGELDKQLKDKINKLSLTNHIYTFGFCQGKKKNNIFRRSKIVLHPAIYDSGGMAMAEAMAWGLPGISFDLESLKTYYPEGVIKIPLFNTEMFSKNIIDLLTNRTLYRRLSNKAKKFIHSQWGWDQKSEQVFKNVFS